MAYSLHTSVLALCTLYTNYVVDSWATSSDGAFLRNASKLQLCSKSAPEQQACTVCRDHYIPTTEDGIPTGQITPVKGTAFDFTEMKRIGKEIDETPAGYDHNWVLHGLGRQAMFSTKAGSVASEM